MRRPLVAGNWKLNGSLAANRELLAAIMADLPIPGVDVMVCPSFVHLPQAIELSAGKSLLVGAQDVSVKKSGAFTGEVSAQMLRDLGCTHAIVGHSERRSLFGDTNAIVTEKFAAARAAGLVPILCIGETLEQRESGQTESVVEAQVAAVLDSAGPGGLDGAIIAYEPVWAIGTGRTASPQQAQEVHAAIRGQLVAADARIGGEIRILYGGSVKGANAADLFAMQDIDGGLVGGASLDARDFLAICRAASGTDS